jgi:hypothetical protein
VLSAVLVYIGIGLVRLADPTAYQSILNLSDFGTSAMIAAWIGAIAYVVWHRWTRVGAVGLCTVSALVGWYLKGALTVLDVEHAFALAFGVAAMRYAPRLRLPVPRLRRAPAPIAVRTEQH